MFSQSVQKEKDNTLPKSTIQVGVRYFGLVIDDIIDQLIFEKV